MSVALVTYELKTPGRNYQPVFDYVRTFTHCKEMETVWLLDTPQAIAEIRDRLRTLIEPTDIVLVVRLTAEWASSCFNCGNWLNKTERGW
jgi:hypothetical protein